jgi:drug/metabolite transporter (DMT)-like permease
LGDEVPAERGILENRRDASLASLAIELDPFRLSRHSKLKVDDHWGVGRDGITNFEHVANGLFRRIASGCNVSFGLVSDEPSLSAIRKDTVRGTLIFAVSAALFGLMAFTVKLAAARGVAGPQIAVIRFAAGLLPLLVPSVRKKSLEWTRMDLLFYRGFFGGVAVLCYFSAIEHVPVGIATLLNYTTPLFSGIYAAIFAGEPLRARVVVPLTVAFSGVYIVIGANGGADSTHLGFGNWELVALASAIFAGAAVTSIRVARRTENSWAIFTSFSLFGLITTLPFGIWQWTWPDATAWVLLAAVGALSIAAQLFMTHAFRWVQTLIGGVISQVAVIVSMSLGILVLGERLTLQSALGSALTLAGVIAVMLVSARGFVKEQ